MFDSFPLNLLFTGSHEVEIFIVKFYIQGRNYEIRVQVEPPDDAIWVAVKTMHKVVIKSLPPLAYAPDPLSPGSSKTPAVERNIHYARKFWEKLGRKNKSKEKGL